LVEAVECHDGEVLFVRGVLTRWNLTSSMAGRDTLEVDNSALSAETVARRIVAYFSLPLLGGEAGGGVRS
jgi:hypothetical protein